ncbi:hypothetical protein BT63DRAFT_456989 [Microthyrium microscopicum]|uniref:Uncharacterized protein n=1 Tax=Microthyrium microscopicum TaxID=703497 RepID=A0A6A6U619_9PEZI|nr:hypothetical protein BT63DRAFT_456989 [Microthyrium microscopicum]
MSSTSPTHQATKPDVEMIKDVRRAYQRYDDRLKECSDQTKDLDAKLAPLRSSIAEIRTQKQSTENFSETVKRDDDDTAKMKYLRLMVEMTEQIGLHAVNAAEEALVERKDIICRLESTRQLLEDDSEFGRLKKDWIPGHYVQLMLKIMQDSSSNVRQWMRNYHQAKQYVDDYAATVTGLEE